MKAGGLGKAWWCNSSEEDTADQHTSLKSTLTWIRWTQIYLNSLNHSPYYAKLPDVTKVKHTSKKVEKKMRKKSFSGITHTQGIIKQLTLCQLDTNFRNGDKLPLPICSLGQVCLVKRWTTLKEIWFSHNDTPRQIQETRAHTGPHWAFISQIETLIRSNLLWNGIRETLIGDPGFQCGWVVVQWAVFPPLSGQRVPPYPNPLSPP